MISLKQVDKIEESVSLCVLYNEIKELSGLQLSEAETNYIKSKLAEKKEIIVINQYFRYLFLVLKPHEELVAIKAEKLRKLGFDLSKYIEDLQIKDLHFENDTPSTANLLDLIEGLVLSAYQFLKYKSDKKKFPLKHIYLFDFSLDKTAVKELSNLLEAVYLTRDLVNEPLSTLTAEVFSEEIIKIGKEAGFKVEVLNKSKIKTLKMGGLLAVNQGSLEPPTFNVLEYKPNKYQNEKPVILVGKGVVYDTGGYSLKPADSLDWMKCDMAGAAAVVGAMYAIAKNKLPIHVVGLIPATENRIDGNAFVPGDIITMFNETTVEVLNTDAEGRLILADALAYAAKYEPSLVIDLATLTGSAMRAIGKEGSVMMGTAENSTKELLINAGNLVHERLVEFPLWEEYAEQIKSEIADLQNLGGSEAGAITAGMFLKHFTNYPWIHLDIAGTAFLKKKDNYRGSNGTGVGVRLLYKFVRNMVV
jgi:leucyl aminopeptidase